MNGQSSIFSYKSLTIDENGWFNECSRIPSPHFNERPQQDDISLLVIHNISLPPGKFGGPFITDLLNKFTSLRFPPTASSAEPVK